MSESYEDSVKLPPLTHRLGSLFPIEKSLLGHLILLVRPRLIVELGVWEALTTLFMCDVLAANGIEGIVVGFDLPEVIAKIRSSNERVNDLERIGRVQLIPGQLPESLIDWLRGMDQEIDLALVDAMHKYRSVFGELDLLWRRLSPDGYIICDDYSARRDGVRYAVDRFAATRGDAMVVPLVASQRSDEMGLMAKLVVLRRRPYQYKYWHWMTHYQWPCIKHHLLTHGVIGSIWRWVRPVVRREAD